MSNIILPPLDGGTQPYKKSLMDYVQSNPNIHLGVEDMNESSKEYDLTFLFKVLSIEKVLSIQAHPDKYLAAQLHIARPTVYKDSNHKPEMAIALDDNFEALSGFRPINDIENNILEYPEFANVIGIDVKQKVIDSFQRSFNTDPKSVLKDLFRAYMTANDDSIKQNLELIVIRLTKKKEKSTATDLDNLILKLSNQFPGDSGVFAPIIFNYLKLNKGEAFFIGANEPHAYIKGEILECMACSDNVVRAGLTPKLKDIDTLVKMLTYKSTRPEIVTGDKINKNCRLYLPPVEDFAIEFIEVAPGDTYLIPNVRSPSILLTLHGCGQLQQSEKIQAMDVSFGKAAFMSANTTALVVADVFSGVTIVRALSNVHLH